MEIKLSKQVIRFLDKLNNKQTVIILDSIEGLTENPPKGDIKRLK